MPGGAVDVPQGGRVRVVQVAVEVLRPQVLVGLGINKLHVDSHAVAGSLHAALEDVGNVERRRNLARQVLSLPW